MQFKDNPSRIEYDLNNSEKAVLRFNVRDDIFILTSVYVPPEDRKKGIAGKLTERAFQYIIENDYRAHLICPYAQWYYDEHKEQYKEMKISG